MILYIFYIILFIVSSILIIVANNMVKLEEQSSINQYESPVLYQWDTAVRKSYNMYQRLIDAKTYQLQRVQRYLLVHRS
jgi:hypothetical protein